MPLFKLRFGPAARAAGRGAADLLSELPQPRALAVTLFESGPATFVVEAYYDPQPPLTVLTGALASLAGTLGAPTLEDVPDQNWVALSQAALPPVAAGRFRVHGRHDRERTSPRRTAIEIEAGEAFGTGHSATTALCLEALDGLARRRPFANVLDLGCGTGVLAIAASRILPAARAMACDNDPVAVGIARENARHNRVGQRVQVWTAAGLDHAHLRRAQPFDLVLSNLLPSPLIALAPDLRRAIAARGVAVLSGLLNHQASEVASVYQAAGFRLLRRKSAEGWTLLVLEREPN